MVVKKPDSRALRGIIEYVSHWVFNIFTGFFYTFYKRNFNEFLKKSNTL